MLNWTGGRGVCIGGEKEIWAYVVRGALAEFKGL